MDVHDLPFADGICGTLVVTLTAHTPLIVGAGDADRVRRSFQLPDHTYAIPGSSLRGMLRNVVEIVSHGRLRTNDHRHSIRDLTPGARDLYGAYMAELREDPETGAKSPVPLVSAGWLVLEDGYDDDGPPDQVVGRLLPCSFAKVHYRQLMELAAEIGIEGFRPGQRQSGPDKYGKWDSVDPGHRVGVVEEPAWQLLDGERMGPSEVPRRGRFAPRVGHVVARGDQVLVFTGQPNAWKPEADRPREEEAEEGQRRKRKGAGNPKQHDFVFWKGESYASIPVRRRDWMDFRFIHADRAQQKGFRPAPNTELKYWLDRRAQGSIGGEAHIPGIPVFFLPPEHEGAPLRMGLAMMFRLGGRYSTLEATVLGQHENQGEGRKRFDLAESLFGHVPQRQGDDRGPDTARKGRVSVGLCRLPGATPTSTRKLALLAPKASYWPFYVEQQRDAHGADPLPRPRASAGSTQQYAWHTWTQTHDGLPPIPRGWKRYRAREGTTPSPVPKNVQGRELEQVITRLEPLEVPKPASFAVRVHNLRPWELGALVFAIELGGFPGARHQLGMGRPYGLGQVTLRVDAEASRLRTVMGSAVQPARCRDAFVRYMVEQVPGWLEGPTLKALFAAAVPPTEEEAWRVRYPRLVPGRSGVNEFAWLKKRGKALPLAPGQGDVFEERWRQWVEQERSRLERPPPG